MGTITRRGFLGGVTGLAAALPLFGKARIGRESETYNEIRRAEGEPEQPGADRFKRYPLGFERIEIAPGQQVIAIARPRQPFRIDRLLVESVGVPNRAIRVDEFRVGCHIVIERVTASLFSVGEEFIRFDCPAAQIAQDVCLKLTNHGRQKATVFPAAIGWVVPEPDRAG